MLKKIVLSIVIIATTFTMSGCRFVDKKTREAMQPVTLTYWRVFDDGDAFAQIVNDYRALHPHISIEYKKLRFEEYEQELLDAFAEDRGPDMFSVHNTWMPKYKSKLEPLPPTTTLPYNVTTGTIKKETFTELRTTPSLTINDIDQTFVPVVLDDVVMLSDPNLETNEGPREHIYGIPLSVDTMVMYYNRDLFNLAGVVQPPQTWEEFQDTVKAITRVDQENTILQSAAGYGLADNVERYFDLLSLLMMQNGTVMIDDSGRVAIDSIPANIPVEVPPALQALRFYTDFASPIKEVYTWNEEYESNLQAFIDGESAIFFGYAYHLPTIKAQAPQLELGISSMPQIVADDKPVNDVNYANYWVEVVSEKTQHTDEAWDFLQYIAQAENAQKYTSFTNKPTAHRSLINSQLDDLELGVFASQLLTSKSWYKGYDIRAAERVVADMINTVVEDPEVDLNSVLLLGAQKLTQTLTQQ
jgi:ABC-type glycerol-3-phosphate transport system substrate-binding protein